MRMAASSLPCTRVDAHLRRHLAACTPATAVRLRRPVAHAQSTTDAAASSSGSAPHNSIDPSSPGPSGASSSQPFRLPKAEYKFTEDMYQLQQQSVERAQWASQLRSATGNRDQQFWEPNLSPPPLLDNVVLVLMSPRRPVSVGTVARAASCFEVSSIRIVQPRCGYVTRHSKSASKGAQYLLYKAKGFGSIQEATADCDLRIAFSRWVAGRNNAFFDLSALLSHPTMQEVIHQKVPDSSSQPSTSDASAEPASTSTGGPAAAARPKRIALVFGREELGLSDEEVDSCEVACSIPIGRLQESLSLSHAVSIVLSTIYAQRLAMVTGTSGSQAGSGYAVRSLQGLAEGYDASGGTER